AVGASLPEIFASSGLTGIQVHHVDKAMAFIPPYATAEERRWLDAEPEPAGGAIRQLDYDEAREALGMGGGHGPALAARWGQLGRAGARREPAARCAHRWHVRHCRRRQPLGRGGPEGIGIKSPGKQDNRRLSVQLE